MYCKACGEPLGNPQEDLHDPDGLAGIIEGGVDNEGTAHLVVVDGEKGFRYQCSNTGQMTKLLDQPPEEDKGSSGGGGQPEDESKAEGKGEPSRTGGQSKGASKGEVYDLKDDTDPMKILHDVVSSSAYGLNQEQIDEVMSWGEIFNEQVPPNDLEEILSNLKGVSKQQASLMSQKYEGKVNKWIREQSSGSGGPSIGAAAGMSPNRQGGGPQRPRRPPQRPPSNPSPDKGPETEPSPEGEGVESDGIRESRRKHRVERRNEVVDEAAEQFASKAAANMAEDFGKFFGEGRDIAITVLKKKAKKDPDWFLEKAEKWDMDVFESIMEPSETRMEEMQGGGSSPTTPDDELEAAVSDIAGGDNGGGGRQREQRTQTPEREQNKRGQREPEQEQKEDYSDQYSNARDPEQEEAEEVNRDRPIDRDESPMTASPEQESEEEGEDLFDEIMGDVSEE